MRIIEVDTSDFDKTFPELYCPSTREVILSEEVMDDHARALAGYWHSWAADEPVINADWLRQAWDKFVSRQDKEQDGCYWDDLEAFLLEHEMEDWIVYSHTSHGMACGPSSSTALLVVKSDTIVREAPRIELTGARPAKRESGHGTNFKLKPDEMLAIDNSLCTYCDRCLEVMPVDKCIVKVSEFARDTHGRITGFREATSWKDYEQLYIDTAACTGCGACIAVCPVECIHVVKRDHAAVGIRAVQSKVTADPVKEMTKRKTVKCPNCGRRVQNLVACEECDLMVCESRCIVVVDANCPEDQGSCLCPDCLPETVECRDCRRDVPAPTCTRCPKCRELTCDNCSKSRKHRCSRWD